MAKIKDMLRNRIQEIKNSMEPILDEQIKEILAKTKGNFRKLRTEDFKAKFVEYAQ